jgi:hypothetical protein
VPEFSRCKPDLSVSSSEQLWYQKIHFLFGSSCRGQESADEWPTLSHGLSPVLQGNCPTGFQKTVTAVELSFLLHYHSDSILAQSREKVSANVTKQIGIEKCLTSIPWSINSIHVSVDVPISKTHHSAFLSNTSTSDLVDEICLYSRR